MVMTDTRYNNSNGENIFASLKPNCNEQLSKLNKNDLQDLISLINKTSLHLRENLGLNSAITLGLELEVEHTDQNKIYEQLNKTNDYDKWTVKDDASLVKGAEITTPILTDTQENWAHLEQVCSILQELADIGDNAGGHIHIGSNILNGDRQAFVNFIKIWSVYEHVIFRFSYGEFLTARPKILTHAKPMSKDFWVYTRAYLFENTPLEELMQKLRAQRRQAVNFRNVKLFEAKKLKNTIEFRCPNGTINPIVWQNNVNLFTKLLLYATNTAFNDDLVEKRHAIDGFIPFPLYDKIFLEHALELCDMVFDNNLDKIYFLKQYLKSLQVLKPNEKQEENFSLTKKHI